MTDILDLVLTIRLNERVGRIGYITHHMPNSVEGVERQVQEQALKWKL
jgi:hypothetical protein